MTCILWYLGTRHGADGYGLTGLGIGNIGYDAWSDSLGPKVDGSWNLHQQLPRDPDFFIL